MFKIAYRTIFVAAMISSWSIMGHAQQHLRAWHTNGQTFLLWQHSSPVDSTDTYDIYRSDALINSLIQATWVGRVFADDGANHRIQSINPDARWILPDSAARSVTVEANEDFFVFTPHNLDKAYYAVVVTGDSTIGAANSVGPVIERPAAVAPHIQHEGVWLTVYAHWIDGSANHGSGRADYPVMGNQYANGHGFNFAVWKPVGSLPPGKVPLVVFIHGGYGNLLQLAGSAPLLVKDGLLTTLDDPLRTFIVEGDSIVDMNTFWLGYRQQYNRFAPALSAEEDTVIDYTARRVWWEIEWIKNNLEVDPHRVAITGASMGGEGTALHTQLRPDLFSAGLAYVPLLAGPRDMVDPWRIWEIFGDSLQLLPAELNSIAYHSLYDVMDQRWRVRQPHEDWPFTILVSGVNDARISWEDNSEIYQLLDSIKIGFWYYWDERTHTMWDDVHFQSSEHIAFRFLTKFRNDQSYPGFSNMDLRPDSIGRQPDPKSSDLWGSWGGYLEWAPETIVDIPSGWAATMWVMYESAHQNDIPVSDTISVDVTPRRLQRFSPQPGGWYRWRLVKEATDDSLQYGFVQADNSGLITVTGLRLIKERTRLAIAGPVTNVEDALPVSKLRGFSLRQNYPNPFNQSTIIRFSLPQREHVTLKVFDIRGSVVATLIDDNFEAGNFAVSFTPQKLTAALYFYKITADNFVQTRKAVLIR